MSKQDNRENAKKKQTQAPSNVAYLPQSCPAEGCSTKPKRAGFCQEHFEWFKFGLITKKGEQAKDFDKKYQTYIHKFKKTA